MSCSWPASRFSGSFFVSAPLATAVMSTLTPEQLAYMQAHYNDTRVPVMFGTYITAIAIAVLSTAARITAKRYTRNGLGVEDVLAVLATVRNHGA